jgi:hypothetical protein
MQELKGPHSDSDIPPGILEAYTPLADAIAARVPKKHLPIPKLADQRVEEV